MSDLAALRAAVEADAGNPPRVFSAPGRVNLIGEHTDYNQGFVLPIAIDRRTFVAATARHDRRVQVHSLDLNQAASFALDAPKTIDDRRWINYVEGVARLLDDESGTRLAGANLAVTSDVPMGAGLSSSAALEMSTGLALATLAKSKVDLKQLALLAQRAEHVYAGTKCGVMDQLAAAFGQKDHALLIDCQSIELTPIHLNFPDHAIVVCNTNVRHQLADSAYNERRAECELAVAMLHEKRPRIRSLRDVSLADFERWKGFLPNRIARRCRHVITENARTLRAATALIASDTREFGGLMVESHRSLRDDFEVSCYELDLMVEIAMSCQGVAGARMTGGGFGGCSVNLVRRNAVESFCQFVENAYESKTKIAATTYVVNADVGAHEVTVF